MEVLLFGFLFAFVVFSTSCRCRDFKLGSKGEGDIAQVTRHEPRLGVPGSGVRLTAQLKCVYTNARSMGNTQCT